MVSAGRGDARRGPRAFLGPRAPGNGKAGAGRSQGVRRFFDSLSNGERAALLTLTTLHLLVVASAVTFFH